MEKYLNTVVEVFVTTLVVDYLNTHILMLVFKYLLGLFKYLTIAYNSHTVKIYIVINYCAHIMPT